MQRRTLLTVLCPALPCAGLVFDVMPEAFLSLKGVSVTTFNIWFDKRE